RTLRDISVLNEYFAGSYLDEIVYTVILKTRALLEARDVKGHGWKTKRKWKAGTVNRCLAVLGSILSRCASSDWADVQDGVQTKWIDESPTIPLLPVAQFEPPTVTRDKVCELLN